MDSPIRSTKQEDKHNVREEIRGGLLREVWDELDANGSIIKTAVWDILDRNGKPLGEQSWDEYEEYVDLLRESASAAKVKVRSKTTLEQRRKRHEEALKRYEENRRQNRTNVASILEYYLEENPDPFEQIPIYKLYELVRPYIDTANIPDFSPRKFLMTIARNKEFFKEMGFTFGRGWSALSRIDVIYVGYKSTAVLEDSRKRGTRDAKIKELLKKIPAGKYPRMDLAKRLTPGLPDITTTNLSWILARNAPRFDLLYSYEEDILVKEK